MSLARSTALCKPGSSAVFQIWGSQDPNATAQGPDCRQEGVEGTLRGNPLAGSETWAPRQCKYRPGWWKQGEILSATENEGLHATNYLPQADWEFYYPESGDTPRESLDSPLSKRKWHFQIFPPCSTDMPVIIE